MPHIVSCKNAKSVLSLGGLLFIIFNLLIATDSLASENKKILIVETSEVPFLQQASSAFSNNLIRQVGQSRVHIETRNADGNMAKAINIFEQVQTAKEQPDLIVTVATLATRAAMQSKIHETIPVIFLIVADPINEGIVSSFERKSEYNITGETHIVSEQVKLATFDTLIKANKGELSKNPILLVHSSYPSAVSITQSLLASRENPVSDLLFSVRTPYVEGDEGKVIMYQSVREEVQQLDIGAKYYWMTSEPLSVCPKTRSILRQELGLTQVYAEDIASVKNGALMGISSDLETIGRNAANSAIEILYHQKDANDFAVKRTTDFQLSFNLTTAIEHDIVIPSALLRLAGDNVFW